MRLNGKIIILVLIIVLMGMNVTDNHASDTAKESWAKPTLLKWEGDTISIGGISPKEIDGFFIWSVTKEEMVWYMSLKGSRYKSYTKESRTEKVTLKYKTVPDEWRQWIPYNKEPREIKENEIIKIYFGYTMNWFFGPRGERVEVYFKKTAGGFEKMEIEIGGDDYMKISESILKFIYKKSLPPFGSRLDAEEIQRRENLGGSGDVHDK